MDIMDNDARAQQSKIFSVLIIMQALSLYSLVSVQYQNNSFIRFCLYALDHQWEMPRGWTGGIVMEWSVSVTKGCLNKQDVEKRAFSFELTEKPELGLRRLYMIVGMRTTAWCLFTSSHRFNELFKIQRANIQTWYIKYVNSWYIIGNYQTNLKRPGWGNFTKFRILVKKDLIIFQLKSDTILNQDYHFEFVWVCVRMSI